MNEQSLNRDFLIESAIHSDTHSSDGNPTEVATMMPTEDTTVAELTRSYTHLRNLHSQTMLNIDNIIYHWINPRFRILKQSIDLDQTHRIWTGFGHSV